MQRSNLINWYCLEGLGGEDQADRGRSERRRQEASKIEKFRSFKPSAMNEVCELSKHCPNENFPSLKSQAQY